MLIFINLQATEAAVKAVGCGKKEKEHKVLFVLKKLSEKIISKTLKQSGHCNAFQPSIHLLLIPFLMFFYFSLVFPWYEKSFFVCFSLCEKIAKPANQIA